MSTTRSLWPREHGAYAELAFPILTGLSAGAATVAALCLAAATVAFFLAHEPMAVASGIRGGRLRDAEGSRARVRAGWLAALGLVLGTVGFAAGSGDVRRAVLVPVGAVLALLPWILAGRQKTLSAEIVVVAAFAAVVLPLAVAAGATWRFAWTASGVWFVSFTLATLAVHALKLRHKRGTAARWVVRLTLGLALAVALAAIGAALGEWLSPLLAAAILPPVALVLALAAVPVHPRNLKRVGWALVGANSLTWLCLFLL
jgi:hypothetical protein